MGVSKNRSGSGAGLLKKSGSMAGVILESEAKKKGRLGKTLNRWFPERQVMLRSEGKVSFITLSKRLQLTVVATMLVLVGWSGSTLV